MPLFIQYPTWFSKTGPFGSYKAYFNVLMEVEAVINSSGFDFTGLGSGFTWLDQISGTNKEFIKVLPVWGYLVPDN